MRIDGRIYVALVCRTVIVMLSIIFWLSLAYLFGAFIIEAVRNPRAGIGMVVFVGTVLVFLRAVYLIGIGLWDVSQGYRERVRQLVLWRALSNKHSRLACLLMTDDEFSKLSFFLGIIERQRTYRVVVRKGEKAT